MCVYVCLFVSVCVSVLSVSDLKLTSREDKRSFLINYPVGERVGDYRPRVMQHISLSLCSTNLSKAPLVQANSCPGTD